MMRETAQSTNERLSSLEADVRNFDLRLASMERKSDENFAALRTAISGQKQPITAFAGWAAVILTLVFAFGAPLKEADHDILMTAKELHERQQKTLNLLLTRELDDAATRGAMTEKFKTLEEQLIAAIQNRKDVDSKHIAAQNDLRRQIVNVQHSLDNGLGRRITEVTNGLRTDIEWLKSKHK